MQELLTSRCAGGSCHNSGPGGIFPPLADTPVESWVGLMSQEMKGQPLVVPNDPENSYLYKKVAGTQGTGGGALMPLGVATPIPDASKIRDWIAAGAQTSCSTAAAGEPSTDPNSLDQSALFRCPANAPPSSSPERIRRIDSPEWTYALPEALTGGPGALAYLNPFTQLVGQAYSTYALGSNVDTSTLDLFFQVLPDAPKNWTGGTFNLKGVSDNATLNCIWGPGQQAVPTDACIDDYVDVLLRLGILARSPTATEHANVRAFLVTALAAENGDATKRKATLSLVDQAAWLMSAALFRTELGSPAENDPAKRNRLSNDELALAVGSMVSYRRPGAPMIGQYGFAAPSDPDDACHAWLYKIRDAADNGTLQDPAVIKSLLTAYGGGVDPGGQPLTCTSGTTVRRRDQAIDYNSVQLAGRGEYWLAPRIAGFFREWLAYGTANNIFKDQPGQTSRFLTTADMRDATTNGFASLQNGLPGSDESNLVQQLDDTIARTVIDAANNHEDVFKALMTTRLWHLPSDRGYVNTVACKTSADCKVAGFPVCTVAGLCGNSSSGAAVTIDRVYNEEGVPHTDAGRWVMMPPAERSGVLTHPAWLTAAGADNFQDDPNLIHRGKWIRQNLFCETVPGLSLVGVPAMLGPRSPTTSARDRVATAIDSNPTCLGCHRLMNTLGYPFEMYDAAGFLRMFDKYVADPTGKPTTEQHAPDATSLITNLPDPALNVPVANAVEFAQRIATSDYARRCFIRQAFRYFMGRDETMADQCTFSSLETALDNGSFFDMLGTLASSDAVIYRSTGGN